MPEDINVPSFASTRPERLWKLANVSASDAEESLAEFRNNHVQWFPFVHIPADVTSAQLLQDRPFLWLNITLLASRDLTKHRRMGEIGRQELSQAMVLRSEKSIDLLLGLLAFMGW
jgi:hypothetical protein